MTSIQSAAPTSHGTTTPTRATTPTSTPLEPSEAIPTIPPYKASVGGWTGTVLGGIGIGAGVAGVTVLGAGVLALLGGGGIGFMPTMGAAGVLGVAGAIFGGVAVYTGNKSRYERNAQARIEETRGTPTLTLAKNMIGQYDHDSSGTIELDNPYGLQSTNERVRSERNYRLRESRNISAYNVWKAADTDPADGKVTDVELATMMAKFDTDASGTLTTAEKAEFDAAHPVITEAWVPDPTSR